jgi:lysophospholipase L1-like esterase
VGVYIGATTDNGSGSTLQVNGTIHNTGYIMTPYVRLGNMTTDAPLVFVGDSRTAGLGGPSQPWPNLVTPVETGIIYAKSNLAVGGSTTSGMVAVGYSQCDPLMSYWAQAVVVIWGGVNDFASGVTAQQAFKNIKGFCADRRRFGALVIVATEPSCSGYETQRNAFNTLIYAHWTEFADGLIDYAANATIGPDGSAANTTYYTDGIHFTDAGNAILASVAETVINAVIAGDRNQNNMFFGGSNGSIGIGTRSPVESLDVRVGARFAGAYVAGTDAGVYAGYNSTPRIMLSNGDTATAWEFDNASGVIRWVYGGATVPMALNSAAQLTLTGTNPYYAMNDSGNRNFAFQSTSNRFRIIDLTSSTEALTINSTGMVGINNVSPTAWLHPAASTTVLASLCLPHGTAPTAPVNGDMWTTTAGLFVRINGATVGPLS